MRGIVALLLALAACGGNGPSPDEVRAVEFPTGAVRIETGADTIEVPVEIAATDELRAYGLMERDSLAADAGMLFLYDDDQPADAGFWMFRTRIPLDIAYADADGTIVSIMAMDPCESPDPRWCPGYEPGVPYRSTLEVNRGFFARHGVEVGDRIRTAF